MAQKKVAIVTGATTGIGRETALALAKENHKVFLTCRTVDKGREAVAYIQESCPGADLEILLLDLQDLESVRRCASEFKSRKLPLQILVNNAGANLKESWYTDDGIGGSAQVNFLGPYALTRLLKDELTLGAPSRVINVSSIMHRHATIPDTETFLRSFKAGLYSQTKLANVLFTFEAQRRWQGHGIQSFAVDPGSVWSDIWRYASYIKPPLSWVMKAMYAPTWDAAKILTHAATAPDDAHNGPFKYFARGAFALPLVTHPFPFQGPVHLICSLVDWPIRNLSRGTIFAKIKDVPAASAAYDKDLASSLWEQAAQAAGFNN